jgi:hypothetical protein
MVRDPAFAGRDVSAEPSSPAPIILTAVLPPDLAAWATALRRAHFPPDRNYLDAHVTLFHALPPSCLDGLKDDLARIAAATPPCPARLEGVMSLGRGTALKLSSPAMLHLRDDLARDLSGLLSAQDQHRPRLHVTIQNKVSPSEAKALQAELEVEPCDFTFRGIAAWYYRGGPWEAIRQWSFRGA